MVFDLTPFFSFLIFSFLIYDPGLKLNDPQ